MTNCYDENHKDFILDLIDDSVITDSNSPCFSAGKLLDTFGSGFFGKFPHGRNDSAAVRSRDFCQLFLGAPLN